MAYVKEINYCNDLYHLNLDQNLINALDKFDYVVVSNHQAGEFLSTYVRPSTAIIDIDEITHLMLMKPEIFMGLCRGRTPLYSAGCGSQINQENRAPR